MPIVVIASRIVSLLLCLFVAGPLSVPAQGHVSPKNRTWGSPGFSADFASKTSSQVAEPHRESGGYGYDFAPGVHKYLYAHNDPVNGIDPSGHNETGTVNGQLAVTALQYNVRTLEGVGLAAFRAAATRGISGYILKTGAYGILGVTGLSIAGQIAYVADAIKHNPVAATSPQARQQLQTQIETEEQDRGGRVLYHYTDSASVQQIVQDRAITASPAKPFVGFTFPAGAYATDIPPWSTDYTKRDLSALFYGGNQNRDVGWFVAIEQGGFYELQYPGFPHQYVQQAPAGTKVPVDIVGAGPNLMNP